MCESWNVLWSINVTRAICEAVHIHKLLHINTVKSFYYCLPIPVLYSARCQMSVQLGDA